MPDDRRANIEAMSIVLIHDGGFTLFAGNTGDGEGLHERGRRRSMVADRDRPHALISKLGHYRLVEPA